MFDQDDAMAATHPGPGNPVAARSVSLWRGRLQWPMLVATGAALSLVAMRAVESTSRLDSEPRHAIASRSTDVAFDLSELTIARGALRHGGPPKDGIPALTEPPFVAADRAGDVSAADQVIGVTMTGAARAYPLRYLDRHEVVNDMLGGQPIAVTYCPLCDSSSVFDRRDANSSEREFGVSGLLYNSNVLMYDRRDDGVESLWTQLGAVGVSGPGAAERLRWLPFEVTTWESWRGRHPNTTALSPETGRERLYKQRGYRSYFASPALMFPVEPLDERLPPKTPVLAVTSGGESVAFQNPGGLPAETRHERLAGARFDLVVDDVTGLLRIEQASGGVEWCYTFWFAWAAFHPETRIVDLSSVSISRHGSDDSGVSL